MPIELLLPIELPIELRIELPIELLVHILTSTDLLVLDLCFHIIDCVASLDIKSDSLSSECLHKDLHATAKTENQMQSALLLDVVVREGAAIFKLLAGKDKSLLIWRDALVAGPGPG